MTATRLKVRTPISNQKKLLVGLIINPIAGVGGRIGLKGSDDTKEIWKRLESGEGQKVSNERTRRFLKTIIELKDDILFFSYDGEMGGDILRDMEFDIEIIGQIKDKRPTRKDTVQVAKELLKKGVKLVIFIGGDGTACDMYEAVQDKIPLLAVPSGVKMHSACFALNPEIAGMIFKQFQSGQLNITHSEVMDIDEEAFRAGRLSAELKGMVIIPYLKAAFQGGKMASPSSFDEKHDQKVIAQRISEDMQRDTLYLLGSGTTCKAVADFMEMEKTLLGVDALYNRKLIAKDLNEQGMLELLEKYTEAKIIVTVIGNQGFIFGSHFLRHFQSSLISTSFF